MKKIIFTLLCSCIFFYTHSSFAQLDEKQGCEFNGINYSQAKIFMSDLQQAVKENDATKVANLIEYPVRINTQTKSGKTIHYFIKTKEEFIQQYHSIFSGNKKNLILNEKEIFCNYQGAMLGGGFVWFETNKNGAKIFSINK